MNRVDELIHIFMEKGFSLSVYKAPNSKCLDVHLAHPYKPSIHAKGQSYEEALEFAYSTLLRRTP